VEPDGPTGWRALCPLCGDRCLAIGQDKFGLVVVTCRAGCDSRAIVTALGYHGRELLVDEVGYPDPWVGR
jgi:hypothetical protein